MSSPQTPRRHDLHVLARNATSLEHADALEDHSRLWTTREVVWGVLMAVGTWFTLGWRTFPVILLIIAAVSVLIHNRRLRILDERREALTKDRS